MRGLLSWLWVILALPCSFITLVFANLAVIGAVESVYAWTGGGRLFVSLAALLIALALALGFYFASRLLWRQWKKSLPEGSADTYPRWTAVIGYCLMGLFYLFVLISWIKGTGVTPHEKVQMLTAAIVLTPLGFTRAAWILLAKQPTKHSQA